MTGVSHATTGVVIALAVHHPAAVVLAFVSHFLLDSLPHYGDDARDGSDKLFQRFIIADAILGVSLVVLMMVMVPDQWLLIGLCCAFAAIPDLMWLPNHIRQIRRQESKPHNTIQRLHHKIQFEHPVWGIAAEAVWLIAMLSLVTVALASG